MLDYHLHLWEHGPGPLDATLEQVAAYCERAAAAGVSEIAITEHLSRFRQTDAVLRGWWDDDPDPVIASTMARWWDGDLGADLDQYVEVVLAAKAAGLPVVLGLEVDYYAGRMHTVAELLAGYPFDVLLGSVHWVGAWGFDNFGEAAFECRWETHAIEGIWDSYTTSLEELADSGVCDVLAHPDLCKISGRRPPVPEEFHARMAEAAARSGMAAEVNSAGLGKPVAESYPAPDLLRRFVASGVALTTASDAHRLGRVAECRDELRALIRSTGCETLQAYRSRSPHPVPLG
ncbi:MAG: PHP domain-containing protein [Actinomycetota bacterium]|nr:PHP domain-containing protein [Acidimicrobiia bacterium]MDQ3148061.1 PHP domain-containing protein [Actinomycetota bacterium]